MIIAIPTYDRPTVLRECTLAFLRRCDVPDNDVHIFIVDDPAERAKYSYLADGEYVCHYGPLGLHAMRNFITRTFPEGCHILHMDDDIRDIVCMVENRDIQNVKSAARYQLSPLSAMEFKSWTEGAFAALTLSATKLFGVYPVKNGYFMKDLPYVTDDLRFCVGTCWGVVNDHRIMVTLEEKEDYERTLMCYSLYGSVLRYNHIAPVTTYYRTAGGMQSRGTERQVESARSCDYLVATYPQLCTYGRTKKTTGIPEIRLKRH